MARTFSNYRRQEKRWDSVGGTFQPMTANGIFITNSLAFTRSGTILRCLSEYIVFPTAAPVAADDCNVGFGLAVLSSDAVALGATAVPEPLGDPEYPWIYWASHTFSFNSATVDNGSPNMSVRKAFDVKSMRKVKPSESLVGVVQYVDGAGAPPMTWSSSQVRVLLGEA